MNYTALQALLQTPDYAQLDDAAAAFKLNTPSERYDVPASTADIYSHLMATGSSLFPPKRLYHVLLNTSELNEIPGYPQLGDMPKLAAQSFINLCLAPDREIALRENPEWAQALAPLTMSKRFSDGEASGVLDLGKRFKTPGEVEFGQNSTITEADVARARNLDVIETLNALEARAGQAYNDTVAYLQASRNGLRVRTWDDLVQVFAETQEVST